MKTTSFEISSRVKIHDISQLEIKLEYKLEEFQHKNKYKVEIFTFVPRSLDINEFTYPKDEFYSDFHNYIRFKTPSYSFKLILDPEFTRSPINSLDKIFTQLLECKDTPAKYSLVRQTIKEIKLLGCMVRARLRDFKFFVSRKMKELIRDDDYIISRLEEAVRRGIIILARIRGMKKKFENNFPEQDELLKYFRLLEEFFSNLLEEEIIGVLLIARQDIISNTRLDNLEESFRSFLKDEIKYRKDNHYKIIISDDEKSKENYIYQMGQCKKTLSSVLYLDLMREKKNLTQVHLVGSVAAFTASFISYGITLLISKQFAVNSAMLVVLLSMAYVFKDRIKDTIKLLFKPRFASLLPDHNNAIFDSSEKEKIALGRIKESLFFIKRDDADPAVLTLRDQTQNKFLPEEAPEDIILYQKMISIKTAEVRKHHSRTVNFTDIMRLNFGKFFLKMDNPKQEISYYDEEQNKGVVTTGGRTYHINLVLKYTRLQGKKEYTKYERYRVVTNKKGIKRVEFIGEK